MCIGPPSLEKVAPKRRKKKETKDSDAPACLVLFESDSSKSSGLEERGNPDILRTKNRGPGPQLTHELHKFCNHAQHGPGLPSPSPKSHGFPPFT